MPKPRKFFSGPWTLMADPPPCDPGNPARARSYCEKARRSERCTCQFDAAAIAGALEDLGITGYSGDFDGAIDADSLADLTDDLLGELRGRHDNTAVELREELLLLQRLARVGSGIKPIDED